MIYQYRSEPKQVKDQDAIMEADDYRAEQELFNGEKSIFEEEKDKSLICEILDKDGDIEGYAYFEDCKEMPVYSKDKCQECGSYDTEESGHGFSTCWDCCATWETK